MRQLPALTALTLSALMAACGGGGGNDTPVTTPAPPAPAPGPSPSPTPTPPPPAPAPTPTPPPPAPAPVPTPPPPPAVPLALASSEIAQTHVIAPAGRGLQAPNDVTNKVTHWLMPIAGRAALLMVQPSSAETALQVRARTASGQVLGPVAMQAPADLPRTDAGRAAYSTVKFSALLPKEWLAIGTTLEVDRAGFAAPVSIPVAATPGIALHAYTMPLYVFGARAANSVVPDFAMSARNTAGYPLDQEYQQKLPVASLRQTVAGAITFDTLAIPARNDATLCHPAMTVSTWADFVAAGGDMNARMLGVVGDLHGPTADRDGALAAGYYGYVQAIDGGKQVPANTGGGLGGGGSGVSGGDYRPELVYSAIFNHEMGHAYGLPHADAAALTGDYPYPLGTKSGSTWGYDAVKNQLLATQQIAGQSCGSDRMVNGTCWQRTPMSGGDTDLDTTTYRWTTFSDYQAAQIQEGLLDKAFPDAASAGGYRSWSRTANAWTALSAETRARIGTDVLKLDQPVQTVIGSISHFNLSPSASQITVTPAWTGNLPKQIDPTVQADLDLLNGTQPGGWNGYYCLGDGCDYTLVATYADGAVQRVLLPIGYHRFGYPVYTDNGYRATAQNVLDGDNLGTYAVNLPTGHGGLASVAVYNTPFGSKWQAALTAITAASLGTSSAPLVNRWVPSDAFGGGAGAPGTTTFDASACQAGATVKHPTR